MVSSIYVLSRTYIFSWSPRVPTNSSSQQPKLTHQELCPFLAQVRQAPMPTLRLSPGIALVLVTAKAPSCLSVGALPSSILTSPQMSPLCRASLLPCAPPSSPTHPHVHSIGHTAFWSFLSYPVVPPLSLPLPPTHLEYPACSLNC